MDGGERAKREACETSETCIIIILISVLYRRWPIRYYAPYIFRAFEKQSRPRRFCGYHAENQTVNGGYVCAKPRRKCAASVPPPRVDSWLNTKASVKMISKNITVWPDKRLPSVESILPVGKRPLLSGAKMPLLQGKGATLVMFALAQTYIRVYANVCSPWLNSKTTAGLGCKVAAGV